MLWSHIPNKNVFSDCLIWEAYESQPNVVFLGNIGEEAAVVCRVAGSMPDNVLWTRVASLKSARCRTGSRIYFGYLVCKTCSYGATASKSRGNYEVQYYFYKFDLQDGPKSMQLSTVIIKSHYTSSVRLVFSSILRMKWAAKYCKLVLNIPRVTQNWNRVT